jgi:NADH:ubiquinone oxidoreductase subunit 3 (subunit A)
MWSRRDRKRTYSILCKILSGCCLFDVEVIFLYPWAINFKELGMEGMVKMVIFMVLLLVGFFIIKKALEWE